MDFTGKVIWIPGGSGGLGTAASRAFLDAGAAVVVTSRSGMAPAGLPPSERLVVRAADLADAGQTAALVRDTVRQFGRLDALIHLAGGFAGGTPVGETDPATLEAMLSTNLRSAFLCCREAAPVMRAQGSGRIVCTAARAALHPPAGLSAYCIAKAGVIALVQTLAEELQGTGVTANAIAPGTIDTPANRAAMPNADFSAWTPPEQIAQVLLFLASPAASAVNGAVVPV